MLKPAIQTEYIHTLALNTKDYQIQYGLAALDLLIEQASSNDIKVKYNKIQLELVNDTLKNLSPESLDNISFQRIEEILKSGVIENLDIYLLIQWLINTNILPSGTYHIID